MAKQLHDFGFGVQFEDSLLKLDPRYELARLGQAHETEDPNEALAYLAAAYHVYKHDDLVRKKDPTLGREVAAKFGLRAIQAGRTYEEVKPAIGISLKDPGDDIKDRREWAGSAINFGHAALLLMTDPERQAPEPDEVRQKFEAAEEILKSQHSNSPWDPYGTMLCRYYAIFEAVSGEYGKAKAIANDGLDRALLADEEGWPDSEQRQFSKKHAGVHRKVMELIPLLERAGMSPESRPKSRLLLSELV